MLSAPGFLFTGIFIIQVAIGGMTLKCYRYCSGDVCGSDTTLLSLARSPVVQEVACPFSDSACERAWSSHGFTFGDCGIPDYCHFFRNSFNETLHLRGWYETVECDSCRTDLCNMGNTEK